MLKVALVEDDPGIRGSLQELVDGSGDMKCVGAYGSVEAALEGLGRNKPSVLFMDIGLPGISGIEGTAEVKRRWPAVDVIIQTVYDDDEKIFRCICAGATGYILKSASTDEILNAARSIRDGAPMSPAIAKRVLAMMRRQSGAAGPGDPPPSHGLTDRELEILRCLVDGMSYRKTADTLFISPHTVHVHIRHIYEKLQVNSKSGAVSKALKQQIFR